MYGVYDYLSSEMVTDNSVVTESGSWQYIDKNVTEKPSPNTTTYDAHQKQTTSKIMIKFVNKGNCHVNYFIMGSKYRLIFHTCYHGVFIGCLIAISILYSLIYQSVRRGRQWRQKQTSTTLLVMVSTQG
jgi:hypothetical protein